MPAKTKADLLAVTQKEFEKLAALIAPVDPETALAKDADDLSIKDIVAHRAHWIDLFLGWYADDQTGQEVFFPAKGYKWNELPRYNADLRTAQAGLGWNAAVAQLNQTHQRLKNFLQALDNTSLYGGPMKGAKNAWTPGRWAEAAGPSHYRSAAKYIRKRIKQTA